MTVARSRRARELVPHQLGQRRRAPEQRQLQQDSGRAPGGEPLPALAELPGADELGVGGDAVLGDGPRVDTRPPADEPTLAHVSVEAVLAPPRGEGLLTGDEPVLLSSEGGKVHPHRLARKPT